MPFQSEKQRRFLHANHPEIAKRWESEYATGGISNHFRRRLGLKKGSDGPGPGGQGARGQATQNPGSSGGPPGGGSGGQGGAMHYQAPTPTYQNVHQTGAISQTPGNIPTLATSGGPKPHSGPTFAEIEAQKRAALEKKNLAAWEHSQAINKTKTDRAKKTKYLKSLLKNDPLYETYVDKGLLDWENIKAYESDPRLKTDESLKAKQKGWWGYTQPWLGGGENLYVSDIEEFGQEPKGPLHATRSGRWNETIAEKNKRIAETIGHEARHQLLGADNPAMFGDPYSGKVNEALYPQGFVDDETFNLPGKGTHELVNTMGDFQAYNNPEIYGDIYGKADDKRIGPYSYGGYEGIHGVMPRHLSSPVADQLYDASTQFTKDTKARHEGEKYEQLDPIMIDALRKEYGDEDVNEALRTLSDKEIIEQTGIYDYDERDYTGRAVKGNESTARLSKTQTKDLKPSKMYSTSDMKVAYEKAQNMNAKQFKSWASKNGLSGEYVDKLSSALNYNETSAGKVDMIGKDATKMLDLPGLGDDKQELKNAAATLLGIVETSANKYDWDEKSDVKLSLANDFYKDKEKYKKLGINKVTDLDEFIEVVLKDKKAKGGLARKNYFHGGILDINESEEIISDDGNDIELTDYNAAFDDPKDLSTGVKTLFQAKDGGTPRRSYFTGAYGVGGTENEGSTSGGNGGYQNVHQTGAVTQTPGRTPTADRHPEAFPEPKLPPQLSGEGTVTDAIDLARTDFETKKTQLEKKIRNAGIWKIVGAVLGGGITFGLSDLKTAKTMYDLAQVEKNYISLLENAKTQYKKQGLPAFNPHVDTAIQTLDQEILDLTQRPDKADDTGGDGPIYAPLTGAVDEEYAQGYYNDGMSDLDRIRAGQAKRAMINPDWQEQPGLAFGQQLFNSGGLANLFRVKNQ